MINIETITKLISIYKDDEKMLSIIERSLMSFENLCALAAMPERMFATLVSVFLE